MASATTCALSTPSALVESRILSSGRQQPAAPPHCVSLPPPPPPPQSRTLKAGVYSRRIARNVVVMATGESMATGETPAEATTEVPEIIKTIQEKWDKLDDKYAVTSIAVAGVIAIWGSTGLISAIDRLPVIPGFLELVGIGYTGWFTYKNLVFEPDREALLEKVKSTYSEIIGNN